MHSTRQDANLAALQAGAGLPGHILDVVVLTSDPGLLATLHQSAGPEHAIWHAPSADTAVDLLVGGRCSILVADLGALRGDAAALLDRLHAQFPELILMATGRREEEHSVAMLVSDQRIYRFLHKPVSPARANLFLSAASRRYNELRNAVPIDLITGKHIVPRSKTPAIVISLVVLLSLAAGGAFWWQSRKEPVAVAPPPRAVGSLTPDEQIADFLARGEMALATDRLVDPRGNNAVEYYRSVLALQPDNPGAHTGLERVGMKMEARVLEALQERDAARGATALATLQHAVPEYPRLDQLRAELLALSRSSRSPISVAPPPEPVKRPPVRTSAPASTPGAKAATTQTAPTPTPSVDAPAPGAAALTVTAPAAAATAAAAAGSDPTPSELDNVARLRGRGILLEPPVNNAYEQLLALRAKYPYSIGVRTEQQQLASTFLDRTRTALAASDVATASAFLSRVDNLVPNMAATKSLQTQLATLQQQSQFNSNIVQAKTLKRVREVPPVYPRDAERQKLSGWVDVEFTVAPDGSTQDLVVRGAEPQRTFDQAAIDAVKRWRFEPIMRDGTAVAQRAALRIRFELK
ncbi:MAG TPA: energy transducer TonB [Steroidobacteraceae bacterium]|nr:energy transducer TonB [Steroidobacteraceae bacterium]